MGPVWWEPRNSTLNLAEQNKLFWSPSDSKVVFTISLENNKRFFHYRKKLVTNNTDFSTTVNLKNACLVQAKRLQRNKQIISGGRTPSKRCPLGAHPYMALGRLVFLVPEVGGKRNYTDSMLIFVCLVTLPPHRPGPGPPKPIFPPP